ncbi:MAG: hypothetical protein M9962_15380 [Oligoflexia bacterium]|nr:hypothetical protein [Oligoflexia bacterium]
MKVLIPIFLILFSNSAFCLSKIEAIDITKKRIEAIVPYIGALAYTCFVFEKDCEITERSSEAALKWINSEQLEHKTQIEFSKNNSEFMIDGALRVAKTGNKWGAPILFNENFLFEENSEKEIRPLGFYRIFAILLHELGHHQEIMLRRTGLPALEHEELDRIAIRVVTYLMNRTRTTKITRANFSALGDSEVEILQIDREWYNGIRNLWSYIFVISDWEIQEVSGKILTGLKCPEKYDSGHLVFSGVPYYAAFREVRAPKFIKTLKSLKIEQDIGDASVLCVDKTMNVYDVFSGYYQGKLSLEFNFNRGELLMSFGNFTAKHKKIP